MSLCGKATLRAVNGVVQVTSGVYEGNIYRGGFLLIGDGIDVVIDGFAEHGVSGENQSLLFAFLRFNAMPAGKVRAKRELRIRC